MKILPLQESISNSFVKLKADDWITRQRIAGQCLAQTMDIITEIVKSGAQITPLEISDLADSEIIKRNCVPTFKGYKGFPAAVCISVNREIVHGIPKPVKLKDGDVVSFDFGVTFEGAIADSAKTMIYGKPAKREHELLIKTTEDCLYNSIKAIKIGKHIGVIGNAIYKTAINAGFNVITRLGGHGISWNNPHADLFVSNKSAVDEGIRIQPGLTIAIEPLLVPGNSSTNIKVDEQDGWTITTDEISAHTEHSLFIHEDRIEIMSWRTEESNRISREIAFS